MSLPNLYKELDEDIAERFVRAFADPPIVHVTIRQRDDGMWDGEAVCAEAEFCSETAGATSAVEALAVMLQRLNRKRVLPNLIMERYRDLSETEKVEINDLITRWTRANRSWGF